MILLIAIIGFLIYYQDRFTLTKIFTFVIESVVQFDKKAYDIAKNLGTTVGEAKKLQASFQENLFSR